MSRSDVERWNRKYAQAAARESILPDPLLREHAPLLRARGAALDLACGLGDNALYLAQLGNEVFAVDISEAAVQRLGHRARKHGLAVHGWVADLDAWRPPRARFDLIAVFRFLDRGLIDPLKDALRPGGLLAYRTWNRNHLADKPDFRRALLLEHGELSSLLRDLRCIATNDAPANADPDTWWIGQK